MFTTAVIGSIKLRLFMAVIAMLNKDKGEKHDKSQGGGVKRMCRGG
jgi:hypothetical protein